MPYMDIPLHRQSFTQVPGSVFYHLIFLFPVMYHRVNNLYHFTVYLFQVNNGSTRAISKICSKLTMKTPKRRHCGALVSLVLTLKRFLLLLWCFHS